MAISMQKEKFYPKGAYTVLVTVAGLLTAFISALVLIGWQFEIINNYESLCNAYYRINLK